MSNFYPTLPEAVVLQLRVVLNQMRDTPHYLDAAPYTPAMIDFLKELNGRVADAPTVVFEGEEGRLDYVEQEIVTVLKDLTTLVGSLGNADHSEKLQVAKARAGLIEKLVSAREKVWTMKGMADFQAQVVGFLTDICTPDQIQTLKERVKGAE
ncbi:hypothetical protein [Mesorhizobium sp. M7A.F.Ca.MR.362.00.0.0]|uniref:hypothetical protein n=1 Tax=Mesorhizobium sp. M7A.F.Ca.MR.362.00.0.0 TaxID=2496779 RepID=UPI000FD2202A|nr:hypothetical protein [Mesorhizobium sp. M7A.F.Ca.MR.362.00.0.0]RUU75099.1 hypothetical protein EOC06_31580 [Mesorhizobium sp. M7A.F.Ca.MR.362.00.0.0]RWN95431.1 MAG: hypothetical protein EOS05_11600 [Mesorhizobium sp.]